MLFRNFPIERKLRSVMFLTSGIVLMMTCMAFILYELATFRTVALENLTTIARITAHNASAVVLYDDEENAAKLLLSLTNEPNIKVAALYNEKGDLYSQYPPNAPQDLFPAAPEPEGYRFENNRLILFVPITEGAGERVNGTLFIEFALRDSYQRLILYSGIALSFLAGSLILAFFLSNMLQRSISQPIISLANTAKAVSLKHDYSARVQKESEDELGLLADAFNQMLAEIQNHERRLKLALEETKLSEEKVREMNLTLEQRVRERTAELEDAIAQMEAFSYSVSHDLRGPLRSMQGYSRVLLEDYGKNLDETARDYLHRISDRAARLDGLIQDLLTYSRVARAELNIEPVDTEKLIMEIIQQSPPLQEPRAEIHLETPLLKVLGHEAALTQCFSNLLNNAVKFVEPGAKPRVRIWTQPHDGMVQIRIKDNGIGIKPESFDRIFRVFERGHNVKTYEGTGIGLAIVKKAVDRMGGRIGLDSTPGAGTEFWIELPKG